MDRNVSPMMELPIHLQGLMSFQNLSVPYNAKRFDLDSNLSISISWSGTYLANISTNTLHDIHCSSLSGNLELKFFFKEIKTIYIMLCLAIAPFLCMSWEGKAIIAVDTVIQVRRSFELLQQILWPRHLPENNWFLNGWFDLRERVP